MLVECACVCACACACACVYVMLTWEVPVLLGGCVTGTPVC